MPTGCFQSTGKPLAGHFVEIVVSSYLPSRRGPRKLVQEFRAVSAGGWGRAGTGRRTGTRRCGNGRRGLSSLFLPLLFEFGVMRVVRAAVASGAAGCDAR